LRLTTCLLTDHNGRYHELLRLTESEVKGQGYAPRHPKYTCRSTASPFPVQRLGSICVLPTFVYFQ